MRSFRASSRKTRIETWCQDMRWNLQALFQSVIQKNKDWNFRNVLRSPGGNIFQSVIQKNKDWNLKKVDRAKLPIAAFRASSRKTRIETSLFFSPFGSSRIFQSVIQKNKDWNYPLWYPQVGHLYPFRASSRKTRIETTPWSRSPG